MMRAAMSGSAHAPAGASDGNVLVADATGTIVRIPALLPAASAQLHYTSLQRAALADGRDSGAYGDAQDAVSDIASRLLDITPAPFSMACVTRTACGGDERAAIALCTLALHQPIAHVHLGAPRRAFVRARQAPRRCVRVELSPGDVLLMSHATFLHYDLAWPLQRSSRAASLDVAFVVCARAPLRREAADGTRFMLAPARPPTRE